MQKRSFNRDGQAKSPEPVHNCSSTLRRLNTAWRILFLDSTYSKIRAPPHWTERKRSQTNRSYHLQVGGSCGLPSTFILRVCVFKSAVSVIRWSELTNCGVLEARARLAAWQAHYRPTAKNDLASFFSAIFSYLFA